MEFNHSVVSIERILAEDATFKISTGTASAELVASIRLTGLLNPPILIAYSDNFRIVSGFKRIAALGQMGMRHIPARLLDPATTIESCIRIAIIENSSQRSLNLIEQAQAVALLATHYNGTQQLVDAAGTAGLSINAEMANKLKKLAGMDHWLKMGVLDGTIALPVAIQLQDMDDGNAALAIGTMLKELGLSLNRQRELLEWIVSICRRDDNAVSQLLETEEIAGCLQDTHMDRRQKAQLIRKYLKTQRYPTIQHHENLFAQMVNKLKLTKGTFLIAPQHFESPAYSLKFEFRNEHELRQKLQEFDKIVKTGDLRILWHDWDDSR